MKVTLICVGKVKEKFYRDAIKEYEKRLGAYIKLNTIEISDEKVKVENDSEIALAMEKEGNFSKSLLNRSILSKVSLW